MKRIAMLLLAAAMLLPQSCSKGNGSNEEPLVANEYEYSGTMTVTSGGSDNVSENVTVDCLLDEDTRTMKILFHKVKFVPQMPITLDVTILMSPILRKTARSCSPVTESSLFPEVLSRSRSTR